MYFIRIPVQFLTLDVKDSLITLCALLFGPISGAAIALIVPLLELITISDTGVYGFLMNMLSSLTFAVVAGVIYRYKKSMTGAVIGLVSGVCAVTAVMVLANLLITPYYMNVPVETVAAMIPTVLLPFNLVKATLNAALVLLLYKPLSNVLKKIGFLQSVGSETVSADTKKPFTWRSLIVSAIAVVIIAASLAVILLVLR
jgi:riboflavin transporter FmnP